MKDNRMKDALENIARRGVPENTNLWPRIEAALAPHPSPGGRGEGGEGERKSIMQTLRARPVMAFVIVLLALSLLTGVVYAIGRLSGYIPGVGFVEKNSLRVLAEPVSVTREGVTVSIEQVVVDSERTIIIYKTEGLTIAAANSNGEGGGPFGTPPLLRLPDGTTLEESTGYTGTPEPLLDNIKTEGGWPNYVARLIYPPIPSDVNELTLLIPVLQNMPVGAAAENWEITFQLKAAPADMTYAPVIEFTPASQDAMTSTPAAGETSTPALSNVATLKGFTLQLDNVIELEDGYVFTGNLSWDDSAFPSGKGTLYGEVIPVLRDANGQVIPMEEVPVDANQPFSFYEHNKPWSYRTNRKAFAGPLTLSISSIGIVSLPPEFDFEIDLGPNPQIGQVWDVNRDFVVEGHTIRLQTIRLTNNPPTTCDTVGLEYDIKSDAADVTLTLTDVNPEPPANQVCSGGGGGGGGGPVDPTLSTGTIGYRNIPVGVHHYSVSAFIPYVINGPWQVTWTPPLTSAPTPTPEAGACLTLDKWNQLQGRNDPLPSGLGGKILTTVNEGGPWPGIYVSNLDGTNPRKIDTGAWPSLSTDGTRLAYSVDDGIHIQNLFSGENHAIGTDGYPIIWSPDSTRIMFTTTFALYVVNADGSGSQKIDTGSAQVIFPTGWADNQTVVYAVMGGDGFTFTSHNLQSGETKKLFTIQNKAGYGALSSDGQWIVFADRVFGADNWGIFISRLDGSERKMVVAPQVPTDFASAWSPDSQWLILTTQKNDGSEIPVLVNPFTCEAMQLNNVNGMIEGWSP